MLSAELSALIALAPNDVEIVELSPDHWKVECRHVENNREGTSTRWMSPISHSVEEWARAIHQVRQPLPSRMGSSQRGSG